MGKCSLHSRGCAVRPRAHTHLDRRDKNLWLWTLLSIHTLIWICIDLSTWWIIWALVSRTDAPFVWLLVDRFVLCTNSSRSGRAISQKQTKCTKRFVQRHGRLCPTCVWWDKNAADVAKDSLDSTVSWQPWRPESGHNGGRCPSLTVSEQHCHLDAGKQRLRAGEYDPKWQ